MVRFGLRAMARRLFTFVLIAGGVYIALCAVLYAGQRALIYFPTPAVEHPDAAAMFVDVGAARLKIWRVGDGERAVLYFGGNAENVVHQVNGFADDLPGYTVYLVNYRGYGGSGGSPSQSALYNDAVAVYERVAERHAGITVIGRSLGSGVALHLAAARSLERLLLITPFDSLETLARHHFPFVPVSLLLEDSFNVLRKAASIEVPTRILLAERDRIVPHASSRRLAEAFAPGRVEVIILAGTTHNSIGHVADHRRAIADFLR